MAGIVSLKAYAEKVSKSRQTVLRHARKGFLPYIRLGKKFFIITDYAEFEAYLTAYDDMTTKELAGFLGIKESFLQRLCRQRVITADKASIGTTYSWLVKTSFILSIVNE
jgi:hypothetical protein